HVVRVQDDVQLIRIEFDQLVGELAVRRSATDEHQQTGWRLEGPRRLFARDLETRLAQRGFDVRGDRVVATRFDDDRDGGIVPALLHRTRLADDADRGEEQDRGTEDRGDEVA